MRATYPSLNHSFDRTKEQNIAIVSRLNKIAENKHHIVYKKKICLYAIINSSSSYNK
jgi:hypothetical protein